MGWFKDFKTIDTSFSLRFGAYGLECHRIVVDCFWNIDADQNGDSVIGAEDSGKDHFSVIFASKLARYLRMSKCRMQEGIRFYFIFFLLDH